ncbi:MAG: hypothetical protein MKZ81_01750 [Dehalococcoidia bacterium]|nr:hypothetical protein [Dehalococcoidia bacterium]
MQLFNYLLHHDEGIDPTLAEWIHNAIDDFFQVDPFVLIVIGIIGILIFPLILLTLSRRYKQQ